MSATESIYAPYLDRKAKVAVAGIATFMLALLLGFTLLLGLATGVVLFAPLIPSAPSQYAYVLSIHHALPTWGTWALVYFLSTNVIVTLASWLGLAFVAIDTFNVAMGIYRLIYIFQASSTEIVTEIIIFVILVAFWLITVLATAWVWRILRFKAKRIRTYLNDEVELLRGHRRRRMPIPPARTKPLTLRGRAPQSIHPGGASGKSANKML